MALSFGGLKFFWGEIFSLGVVISPKDFAQCFTSQRSLRQKRTKRRGRKLTNQTQPNHILQLHHCQYGQQHPPTWLRVQRQPEKPFVRHILAVGAAILTLEHPVGVARGRIDFIPPAQAHQPAASNIFQVVEVRGEEEDCENEDEDAIFGGGELEIS